MARVRAASEAKDAQAYAEAFLALLDAGEAVHPALIALMNSLEDEDSGDMDWLNAPENRELAQKFYLGLMTRAPRLGGLLDAILSREGEGDGALQFAISLMEMGAPSQLPKDRQAAVLLEVLRKAAAANDPGSHGMMEQAAQALGSLKSKEALPEIERLVLESPDRTRLKLVKAIISMGGPEATASLKRLLERAGDASTRAQIIGALGMSRDPAMNTLLWELSEKEVDPELRPALLGALAGRSENRDRIIQQLRGPQLGKRDRQALIGGLVLGIGQGDKKALWSLYESEQGIQDDLLQAMLMGRDPKATQILAQRLQAGQVTETLAAGFRFLDTQTLRENAEPLKALVAGPATPLAIRRNAFVSLYKVDRPRALGAVMAGFPRLSEGERMEMVQCVGGFAQGPEGKAVLEDIAARDPSEAVRQAAERMLER